MRTKEEITKEYTSLCIQLGERTFQKSHLEKDMRLIQARCNRLNREMQAVIDAEKAAAAQPAAEGVQNGTVDAK